MLSFDVTGKNKGDKKKMSKRATRKQFGLLPPKYNFSLNPYPEFKFWSCPDCHNKTGQRKLPLLIHVDANNLIALNYTNRYCKFCDMLIAHKCEIEYHLTMMFQEIDENVIGNDYLIFGTVEKKAWRDAERKKSAPPEKQRSVASIVRLAIEKGL